MLLSISINKACTVLTTKINIILKLHIRICSVEQDLIIYAQLSLKHTQYMVLTCTSQPYPSTVVYIKKKHQQYKKIPALLYIHMGCLFLTMQHLSNKSNNRP